MVSPFPLTSVMGKKKDSWAFLSRKKDSREIGKCAHPGRFLFQTPTLVQECMDIITSTHMHLSLFFWGHLLNQCCDLGPSPNLQNIKKSLTDTHLYLYKNYSHLQIQVSSFIFFNLSETYKACFSWHFSHTNTSARYLWAAFKTNICEDGGVSFLPPGWL